jgi:hypothetical protein
MMMIVIVRVRMKMRVIRIRIRWDKIMEIMIVIDYLLYIDLFNKCINSYFIFIYNCIHNNFIYLSLIYLSSSSFSIVTL